MWYVVFVLGGLVGVGLWSAIESDSGIPGVVLASCGILFTIVVMLVQVVQARAAQSVRAFVTAHPQIAVRNVPQAIGSAVGGSRYYAARLHKGYVVLRTCGTPPRVCNVWMSRRNTALVRSWISDRDFRALSARLQLRGELYNRQLHLDRLG